jgi:capsular polysaccharide transport system permease protein
MTPNQTRHRELTPTGPAPVDTSGPIGLPVRRISDPPLPAGPNDRNRDRHYITRISTALRTNLLSIAFVILPMILSSTYYLLILSDQYISETRFVIRSMANSGLGSLAIMTQNQGLTRTEDDTNLVNEFLQSRDAIRLLAENDRLLEALANPAADVFYGFPTVLSGSTREDLYQHYATFIDVSYKASTGITTLQVRAFTPEDAQRLAKALLRHAERVVNALNKRARVDAIRFSETVAASAERRVIAAQKKIAEFRNREGVLDPGKQSVATLELINKLFGEKLALQTTLTATQTATPSNPKIPAIVNRLNAVDREIATLQAGLSGSKESMATKLAEFERLSLEQELAAKSLTAALSSLERARQEAARQQLYLERVVEPNLADKAQYPKRFISLGIIFAFCFALYWIARSLAQTILEHDP